MDNLLHKVFNLQCIAYDKVSEHKTRQDIIGIIDDLGIQCDIHIDTVGNMLITKGNATEYPCIVSHYDQVHDPIESLELLETKDGTLLAIDNITMERVGVGGDDKCGILACILALTDLDTCKVAIFSREEVGCQGSSHVDMSFFEDCSVCIQGDRRGYGEIIRHTNGVRVLSREYEGYIDDIRKGYACEYATGTLTDVGELKIQGMTCPAMNIGIGYYDAHSGNEYVILEEMWLAIDMILEIAKRGSLAEHHSTVSTSWGKHDFYQWDKGDELYDAPDCPYCYGPLLEIPHSDDYVCQWCYEDVEGGDVNGLYDWLFANEQAKCDYNWEDVKHYYIKE